MSREEELAPEDWEQEVPWPFHALLAWSLVLVGGFVATLGVSFFGEYRPHELWNVYVGSATWIPALYAPLSWWDAWRGHRPSALRGARMYLALAIVVGLSHLMTNAWWHGGALARPWPVLFGCAPPALLLLGFASRSVTSWAGASGPVAAGGVR